MEAAGLGAFMVSASTMTTLIEHPSFPIRGLIADAFVRRLLMGCAMGLTAIVLIYSPWGRRSGAHLNPSVTLTFLRLGKISTRDAIAYVSAQFAGGLLGIAAAAVLLAPWIAAPAVNFVATVPGPDGPGVAFAGEVAISFVLMTAVLVLSSLPRLAPFTGVVAGLLVATFISFEAPLSGMSMNPARTLGPSLVGDIADGLWIYFVAPPLGMLAAAEFVTRTRGRLAVHCAKLHHDDGPCIFCDPAPSRMTCSTYEP
jgi:aquaporin Z